MFLIARPGVAQTLAGTDQADYLLGWSGATLDGGAGNDILIATEPGLVLNGGAGDDTLLLGGPAVVTAGRGEGTDHVFGFGAGSTFIFKGPISPREMTFTPEGADLVMHAGGFAGQGVDATTVVFHDAAQFHMVPAIAPEGQFAFNLIA